MLAITPQLPFAAHPRPLLGPGLSCVGCMAGPGLGQISTGAIAVGVIGFIAAIAIGSMVVSKAIGS